MIPTVWGITGDDTINVAGSGASVDVTGLHASVAIEGAEFGSDSLRIETDAGTDTVDSSGLAAGVITLIVDGVPV